MRQFLITVRVNVPDEVRISKSDLEYYVEDAVQCWKGGYHPELEVTNLSDKNFKVLRYATVIYNGKSKPNLKALRKKMKGE